MRLGALAPMLLACSLVGAACGRQAASTTTTTATGAGAAAAPAAAERNAAAARHTVTIDGTRFQPEMLTVEAGDSIVWVNKDPFPHTVASEAAGFESPELAPGASWMHAPKAAGEIAYLCTLHRTMKATLRVTER